MIRASACHEQLRVMNSTDPDTYSAELRQRGIDIAGRRVLLSVLAGSDQEPDISEPVVCGGLGRIRHFDQATPPGWPANPLPIVPAARALGLPQTPASMRALVYQNAICNWRCWYCFVPYNLLAGHPARSRWVTAEELVRMYLLLPDESRPAVIDLSGGQPDLVPEWTLWMLDAVRDAGLDRQIYLWSDDNLSNDYLFRFVKDHDISRLAAAPNYGRVGCLKGFDADSFAFNTAAPAEHFDRQFTLLKRLWGTQIDLYCYATFTTPNLPCDPVSTMNRFLDRLQHIAVHLPLRLIPLKIATFGPVHARMRPAHHEALIHQQSMVEAWQQALYARFTPEELVAPVPGDPGRPRSQPG